MRKVNRQSVAKPDVLAEKDSTASRERTKVRRHFGATASRDRPFRFKVYKHSEVRRALEDLFHGKCAYCESRYIGTQPMDVEHWRPKGRVGDLPATSPEIHMGSSIRLKGETNPHQAVLRGVTPRAYLVHEAVTMIEGQLPGTGQVIVGRLAAAKCGLDESALGLGALLEIEGGTFEVSGRFAASWPPSSSVRHATCRKSCASAGSSALPAWRSSSCSWPTRSSWPCTSGDGKSASCAPLVFVRCSWPEWC